MHFNRHAAINPNKVALIWEKDEPGTHETVTYKELLEMVCRIANVLRSHGIKKGDVVAIYLPISPIAVASMLACARIGAIHSVIFAGFSANAIATRVQDASAVAIITANEGMVFGIVHVACHLVPLTMGGGLQRNKLIFSIFVRHAWWQMRSIAKCG